jgi:transcriptional regulator with XRE-family HTH domain
VVGVQTVSDDEGKTAWEDTTGRELVVQRIRQVRKERGLTQQDLALNAGMHRTHLVRIEAGRVNLTLDAFFVLAETLDVAPRNLLPTREEIDTERRRRGED